MDHHKWRKNDFNHGQRLSRQDKTRAAFSTLDVGVLVFAVQLRSEQKRPNLKLKTRPWQLLGSLPLTFTLPTSIFLKKKLRLGCLAVIKMPQTKLKMVLTEIEKKS
jgi:hypothetical protein